MSEYDSPPSASEIYRDLEAWSGADHAAKYGPAGSTGREAAE